MVGGKAIIYSGGSFVDDYSRDDDYRNDLSAIMVANYEAPASPARSSGTSDDIQRTWGRDQGVCSPAAATTSAHAQATAAAAAAPVQAAAGAATTMVSSDAATVPVQAAAAGAEPEVAAVVATRPSQGSAVADPRPCSSSKASSLVLRGLRALPIAITHHWRSEGGPFAEEGGGNPPYFSQVNVTEALEISRASPSAIA